MLRPSAEAAYTTKYTYDGRGLLSSATDALGRTTTYEYNGAEQLTSVRNPAGDTATLGYDNAGNLTRTIDQAGKSLTRTYDASGRLASETDAAGGRTTYMYDKVGRLLSSVSPRGNVSGADPAAYTTSYVYDAAGNLTETTGPTGATTKTTYDAINRPLVVTDPLGHTYDAADQLTSTTTGIATTAYDHDAEGNRTKAGADTYTYDLAGQISAATVGGAAYTYDHDASGNQVTTAKDGAVTNRTQWDPNAPLPILATEYDSAWAVKQSYRYDPLGQPTATKTGAGALFYYHHDTQGSPVDVADSTGTLYQRWAYDSFGTRVLNTTTSGAPASTPSYTGARYQTSTGNLDLHARQYDTATGRFTRSDPADRDLSMPYVSAYAYADNVPSVLTDPSGLTPDDPNNDRVDSLGEALGIFGDAFVDVAKSPFVFLGDLEDAFTGGNGGAGAFIDKYLPVRPAYRLYRAEYMLRQQGSDALADLYAETADELAQQLVLTGVGGLTGWRRTAVATERELQSGGSSSGGRAARWTSSWNGRTTPMTRSASTPSSTGWRRPRRRTVILRPISIRSTTTCSSNRISSTRECYDSTPIRVSPGPGNTSRTEIRIPAISICSRVNCTSRTGCVSTATRTIAAPIRRPWTPAAPGTNMRPRRTV
ncbi:RHS repeat-associated core domain-containing protein [Streptomyces sp. NPDC101223]|uniref:RHS repeat-associated core domain-containing protein n=1 Tax=Streptomyces sp. NPDC101223 TaxID=3366133 RepID=UPI0037FCEA9D